MNKKYLHMQTTAPGSANEVLHNSRDTMNRILANLSEKEARMSGKSSKIDQVGSKVFNLADYSIKSADFGSQMPTYNIATDTFEE